MQILIAFINLKIAFINLKIQKNIPRIFSIRIHKFFECVQSEKKQDQRRNYVTKIFEQPRCICKNFTIVKNRLKITNFVKKVCHTYFGVKSAEQDQTWAPYTVCGHCNSTFLAEMGKRRKIIRIWFFYGFTKNKRSHSY